MIKVAIEGDVVVITLDGWDRIFALRRSVRVPLDGITSVRLAPELVGLGPLGLRMPGTTLPFWPGPIVEGSYVDRDRRWAFWAVRRPEADQLLAIDVDETTSANKYRMLVLQVTDPVGDAHRIQQSVDARHSSPNR